MPPIRAIFDVHFEASVNERAIRPDLDFLRPARRAAAAGALGATSPFPGVSWSKCAARPLSREFGLAVDLINRRPIDMMGSTTCKRPSSLPVTTAAR